MYKILSIQKSNFHAGYTLEVDNNAAPGATKCHISAPHIFIMPDGSEKCPKDLKVGDEFIMY